jgi:hypothetical protein
MSSRKPAPETQSVVMIGAHLDSVEEAQASSTTALAWRPCWRSPLNSRRSVVQNMVRFGFFGGERTAPRLDR